MKALIIRPRSLVLSLASLALLALPAQGVLTAYLKIGDIAGESQRADHEDEIDIHDIHWNIELVEDSTSTRTGEVNWGDIRLSKYLDKATPLLMKSVASGKVFASATLAVRKDSGEAHLDYLVITMENVVVSSVSINGSGDFTSQMLREEITLSYEKITVKYTVQADDHSAGESVEFSWDLKAATGG